MRESAKQKKILDWLNNIPGCKAVPTTQGMYGRKGEPDIYGCFRGQCFVIEVKVPGKEPTALQYKKLAEWCEVKAESFWVTDLKNVKEYFKKILNYSED